MGTKNKYAQKNFDNATFTTAKVGALGEIYWEGIAEMKDLNGNPIPCAYDISPGFAYLNSMPVG
ncbi:MAG: hypothetical protein ACPG7E_01670 [Marinirhabdus sp.]